MDIEIMLIFEMLWSKEIIKFYPFYHRFAASLTIESSNISLN